MTKEIMSIRIELHNIYGGTEVSHYDTTDDSTIAEAIKKIVSAKRQDNYVISVIDNETGNFIEPESLFKLKTL
jgi:hypothetical protein